MTRKRVGSRRSNPRISRQHSEKRGDWDKPLKDNVSEFRPSDGSNCIRIMPITENAPEEMEHWALEVWVHSGIGPDRSTYLCLMKTKNGSGQCPICDERSKAMKAGDGDYADDLRPYRKYVCWVIDRNDMAKGPQVYLMPAGLESGICSISQDPKTNEVLDIEHEEDGFDVFFNKTGSGIKTRYEGAQLDRNPTPLSDDEDEQDDWMIFIDENQLFDVLDFYDADYLTAMFSGEAPKKEEAPATRSSRRRPSVEDKEEVSKDESRRVRTSRRREPIDDPKESLDEEPEREPRSRKRRESVDDKDRGSVRRQVRTNMRKRTRDAD